MNSGYGEIDRKMAVTQAVNSRNGVGSGDGRRQFEHRAAQISLKRGLNRLIWGLRRANDVVTANGVVME